MDTSFDPTAWHDFAVAAAGAGAALAGLLFVAMSINVREILSEPTLPPRAGGAIITFVTPLLFSLCLLVPSQSTDALGVELMVLGVAVGVALGRLLARHRAGSHQSTVEWLLGTGLPAFLLAGATAVAGIGLITESLGGLDWLLLAAVAAIFGGLVQAWVLLIEILR